MLPTSGTKKHIHKTKATFFGERNIFTNPPQLRHLQGALQEYPCYLWCSILDCARPLLKQGLSLPLDLFLNFLTTATMQNFERHDNCELSAKRALHFLQTTSFKVDNMESVEALMFAAQLTTSVQDKQNSQVSSSLFLSHLQYFNWLRWAGERDW